MATTTENRIYHDIERSQALAGDSAEIKLPPAAALSAQAQDGAPLDATSQARDELLQSVLKRYLVSGDSYHLKDLDSTLAFKDKGATLVTQHNDPGIARSMVDLARAKGWASIGVSGTDAFKREIWIYATAQGLETSGYKPTELDIARLGQLRIEAQPKPVAVPAQDNKEKTQSPENAVARREPLPALSEKHEAALTALEAIMRASSPTYPNGHSQAQIDAAKQKARGQWINERVYVGTVVDHGPAPHEHKPDAAPSYFIKLQDAAGRSSELWGVDFPRALQASDHKPGEPVVLAYQGRTPVTLQVKHVGEDGVIEHKSEIVHRNAWDIKSVRSLSPEQALVAKARAKGPDVALVEKLLQAQKQAKAKRVVQAAPKRVVSRPTPQRAAAGPAR